MLCIDCYRSMSSIVAEPNGLTGADTHYRAKGITDTPVS